VAPLTPASELPPVPVPEPPAPPDAELLPEAPQALVTKSSSEAAPAFKEYDLELFIMVIWIRAPTQ
jgi:hypothetical protein